MKHCQYCRDKNICKLYLSQKRLVKHVYKQHYSLLNENDLKKYDDLMYTKHKLRIKKLEKQNQWFLISMYEEFDQIRNRLNKKYSTLENEENIITV